MAEGAVQRFWTPQAWVDGAWARDVLLGVDEGGHWAAVQPGASAAQRSAAQVLSGPVLPGLVNAHSHAFQRAIAGLTERPGPQGDDFWSWRDRMYSVALRITPAQLEVIATQLYSELLAGGYTQVCEFHYLHNPVQGPVGQVEPLEMSLALVRAARRVGMGLTLLPVLYMRSGFGASGLRDDQRRFASRPEVLMRLLDDLAGHTRDDPLVSLGLAIHSLRAVDAGPLDELAAFARERQLPVHIHIAEQPQEVQDCLAHTGQRPIEWLLAHQHLDARWHLVHATHATAAELQGVAQSGASIVICPSTEANLGDGIFEYPLYSAAGGRWSVGSDSHVTRAWAEELRLLEYGQRLKLGRRNVAAQAGQATGAALFQGALAGGSSAAGCALGGLQVGQRADFLVLDSSSAALLGVPVAYMLDARVFSSPAGAFAQVYVAGRHCTAEARWARDFSGVMSDLWS
jgi:formimidoylglutamate deiminase